LTLPKETLKAPDPSSFTVAPPEPVVIVNVTAVSAVAESVRLESTVEQLEQEPCAHAWLAETSIAARIKR
jgi:hypothetical protein